jgi:hypothetical protein
VEGPVAMLLTTTAEEPDDELANRCITLSVNEQPEQTAAIHQRQRNRYTSTAVAMDGHTVTTRQQCAQRLLEARSVILPWADQLTFRTDQTRYRRDHAKYLALIASITLLHQYQRKQFTRAVAGHEQQFVVATLDDLQLANRLMRALLDTRREDLLPQARQLLTQLKAYVKQRAQETDVLPNAVHFTQRQLRETLGWQDRTLRRHLSRLVELEYVLALRTSRGNQRTYQLLDDCVAPDSSHRHCGLIDARDVCGQVTRSANTHLPQSRDSALLEGEPAPNRQ